MEVGGGGRRVRGFQNPTSELDLHLGIYRESPACGAVVHAHPPTATAFGSVGETIDTDALPEVVLLLGEIPLAPYAGPGTPATLEHAAKILHSARSLGRVNRLTREQRDELDTRRRTTRNG